MRTVTTLLALALAGNICVAADLTPGQLAAAGRVYLGDADCDMKEHVQVRAVEGRPGYFELLHKKVRYTVVPEETKTGAVRLEDRAAGIVWLQIPSKSMMLNTKLGQRVVDNCMHAEQKMEAALVQKGDGGMGIAVVTR